MKKILHLSSSFFPSSTGGKEVFVYNLIKNMPEATHYVLIHQSGLAENYWYDGIEVIVLPLPIAVNKRKSYFSWIYENIPGFEEILNTYQPSIVHFHDQGDGASLSHLRICKKAGIKTVLTYHSPGQSCLQRALLRAGRVPCDGHIDITRCTSCRYQIAGISELLANMASFIQLPIDNSGLVLKRNSTVLYKDSWTEFYDLIDVIQIHAQWVKNLLLLNKIAREKIHEIVMGGHDSVSVAAPKESNNPLRIVYVGRCTNIKGVHLLIEAIQLLPKDAPVEIYCIGPYWDDTEYGRKLIQKIGSDRRFIAPRLVAPNQVISELQKMDVCVIPSLWPETGPFTVYDAFAARLPIIGSRYAGIAEKVRDNVDGLLFEWNNGNDLYSKIKMLLDDRHLLSRLKSNIVPNRTFREMSLDIFKMYQNLLPS